MATLEIRAFAADDRTACAEIIERLPDWFALPESNQAYLRGLSELPSWVALRDRRVLGFASVRPHGPVSAELEVLAVDRALHRQGIGRALVAHIESRLRADPQMRLFHVKTRGPSAPDEHYGRTLEFYLALDFVPLLETEVFWGPENPTLILVKPLDRT
jgi:ribosomal protein S18 acetylase RimI-like enzyme